MSKNRRTADIRRFAARYGMKHTTAARYADAPHFFVASVENGDPCDSWWNGGMVGDDHTLSPKAMSLTASMSSLFEARDADIVGKTMIAVSVVELVRGEDDSWMVWRIHPAESAFGPDWRHVVALGESGYDLQVKSGQFGARYFAHQPVGDYRETPAARALAQEYGNPDLGVYFCPGTFEHEEAALTARHLLGKYPYWTKSEYDEMTRAFRTYLGPLHPDDGQAPVMISASENGPDVSVSSVMPQNFGSLSQRGYDESYSAFLESQYAVERLQSLVEDSDTQNEASSPAAAIVVDKNGDALSYGDDQSASRTLDAEPKYGHVVVIEPWEPVEGEEEFEPEGNDYYETMSVLHLRVADFCNTWRVECDKCSADDLPEVIEPGDDEEWMAHGVVHYSPMVGWDRPMVGYNGCGLLWRYEGPWLPDEIVPGVYAVTGEQFDWGDPVDLELMSVPVSDADIEAALSRL